MDALITRIGGFRTVPQIFEDEAHIGGYEDLVHHFTKDKLEIA
jgi:glutaredoxin